MSTSRSSPRNPGPRQVLGRRGEDATASWYRQRGWREVARNWRCPDGEIDLVMTRQEVVAVVEVKARSGPGFGTPAEGVTPLKAARLRRLAIAFLSANPRWRAASVRFDVAEVRVERRGGLGVEVIEDAF